MPFGVSFLLYHELMDFLVAGLGLVVGSFLNVLIWRLNDFAAPKFWRGRSICPRCKKELYWFDNIPLLSFVLLSGKCRFCHRKISWQYPVVEATTAIVFVELVQLGKFDWTLATLAGVFIVIFFSDFLYGLIPDEMILVGVVVGLLSQIGQIWVGAVSALGFFSLVVVTKFRGMGWGDVKLAFLIGFLLGWPRALVAFWLAFVLGGLAAVSLLILKKVRLSDKISFGPYLVLGTIISALWSDRLLSAIP